MLFIGEPKLKVFLVKRSGSGSEITTGPGKTWCLASDDAKDSPLRPPPTMCTQVSMGLCPMHPWPTVKSPVQAGVVSALIDMQTSAEEESHHSLERD